MEIPIRNIYYLLCYAWDKLDEKEKVSVEVTEQTELLELFAKILIQGTRILLKRGIDKSYCETTLEWSGIKGKLEVGQTLKRGALKNARTICTVDEFSGDVLSNQLLVSTLMRLIRMRNFEAKMKAEIKPLIWMFPDINQIEIRSNLFRRVRLNRNNQFYGFLLNICEIIYENSLPTENPGEWAFMDFQRDERKMNQLFESFLFNFYKLELSGWNVKRENLKWQFSPENNSDAQYLPIMRTDISLESSSEKVIIDAKYYRKTLATHYERKKVKSENLYQLFSYLLNQEDDSPKSKRTRGILVYPKTDQDYDLDYQYKDHPIQIRTIDLTQPWHEIAVNLKNIVGEFK